MKIKLQTDQISKILIGIVIISLIIFGLFTIIMKTKPVFSIESEGNIYSFRQNVKVANKTPVYPDEKTLHESFWNNNLVNITMIFVPADAKTNAYYTLYGIEFGFKLTQLYNVKGWVFGEANIFGKEVESIDNIEDEPTNLKLILVPFEEAEGNKIVIDGNRVYLHGKTPQEMDYAVIKTILVAIGNWTFAS